MYTPISKAIRESNKALGIFIETVEKLSTINKGLKDNIKQLDEQENKIVIEKQKAYHLIQSNENFIGNIKSLFVENVDEKAE